MYSFGPAPECVCTTMPASAHAAHTGSYIGWLYGSLSNHRVGIITPPNPAFATRSISTSDSSIPAVIGTTATPTRRSGLWATKSANQRLCARAPAHNASGSASPDDPNPVPNGDEAA